MPSELLMGNQAIAYGALRAGVEVVSGYPGTPSTEVLETIAAAGKGVYVEWSVNEKAAMEVAGGASWAGRRSLVTMKQMGLNVGSDPLMCLSYIGIKGGMVVLVADDPGPISSQTEQDTRRFAAYAKLPVFDPASPEEAYAMMTDAFELSERWGCPVIMRPTTRVCHACAVIELLPQVPRPEAEGFIKDPRWVIFPRLSYQRHLAIMERDPRLADEFSLGRFSSIEGTGRLGVATGGVSYAYVREALSLLSKDFDCRLLKIGTPNPFPEKLALELLQSVDSVLVIEELDPVIEQALTYVCGKYKLNVEIFGKLTGHVQAAGENSVESATEQLSKYLDAPAPVYAPRSPAPSLPVRPPVLCAGCPHRASFYAVKRAMAHKKAVFSGDIGCYTLGNAAPLDMVDTCLCMGAGITQAQGLQIAEPDTVHFAFVGDSTFFASGMTGVANAIYNRHRIVLIVLDNSTTAMTGHQPHPGTGRTMMGCDGSKLSIPKILTAMGVEFVETVDPLELDTAIRVITRAAEHEGVSAVIFKSPCVSIAKGRTPRTVDPALCAEHCDSCVTELGCPAIFREGGHVRIDAGLCNGCGLCRQVCPFNAISGGIV